MISLNYRDTRPIYEQIKESFKRLIVTGAMASGDKLPSVRTLATQLSINPNTIQRAYNELEGEGYTCSVPGKGSFVAPAEDAGEKRRAELKERFLALAAELLFLGTDLPTLEAWIRQAAADDRGNALPEAQTANVIPLPDGNAPDTGASEQRENGKKEERT